ncbi:MAG: flagellar export protein FliJ [Firmicutes bacterium]|mgnify:CR=1 FL=1|nr:flagellar export protein FliJ [Bacillota bacterium]
MTKFKFKLETVLKVKTRVEELRKIELREAELRREKARLELCRWQDEVEDHLRLYREKFQKRIQPAEANNYHLYLLWLNRQVDLALLALDQCEREVAERRQRLIEASKEKKILEKLKEKAYQAYQAEQLNQEIKFLDELGTGRYIRDQVANQEVHGR